MKINSFLIILTFFIVSCKHKNSENKVPNSEQNEILKKENQENTTEKIEMVKRKTLEQLQGKWKEIEYPYRTAEYVSSTVKFVEEGTENNPKFENFEISEDCQFNNDNIRNLKSGDIILTLPETNRCEKLKVSNDTLTLSGFSSNIKEDYNIIYLKLK